MYHTVPPICKVNKPSTENRFFFSPWKSGCPKGISEVQTPWQVGTAPAPLITCLPTESTDLPPSKTNMEPHFLGIGKMLKRWFFSDSMLHFGEVENKKCQSFFENQFESLLKWTTKCFLLHPASLFRPSRVPLRCIAHLSTTRFSAKTEPVGWRRWARLFVGGSRVPKRTLPDFHG